MEVPLDDVQIPDYCLCQHQSDSVIEKIKSVFAKKGQKSAILVHRANDKYNVLVGSHRVSAATELGWSVIKSEVITLDYTDPLWIDPPRTRAKIRNEELDKFCRILSKEFGISESRIGSLVDLSPTSVRDKILLQTELEDVVLKLYQEGTLPARKGLVIRHLPMEEQPEFTWQMISNNWSRDEMRANIENFQKNTIVTIGFDGSDEVSLVRTLREKNISTLVDLRWSENGRMDVDELRECFDNVNGIMYRRNAELAPPQQVIASYRDGTIDYVEFRREALRYLSEHPEFVQELEGLINNNGKLALMDGQIDIDPNLGNNINYHRIYLANELVQKGVAHRIYDVNVGTAKSKSVKHQNAGYISPSGITDQ